MIDKNVTIYDYSQLFETSRENNHVATSKIYQVQLGLYSLQCQHNKTTHRQDKKLYQPVKLYIFFNLTGKLPGKHSVPNHGH